MTMKLATYCLLTILTGSVALAQTHPRKKSVHKQPVVRKQFSPRLLRDDVAPYPLHIEEEFPLYAKHAVTTVDFDSTRVYIYVEQMPTLNGQQASAASIVAITQQLVVPPLAPDGRVFVKFEVGKDGRVGHPQIVKGLQADLDSAVLVATHQLPRFAPGKQSGHVVAVSFTLPITIPVKKQS
jgi:hypothetical protein